MCQVHGLKQVKRKVTLRMGENETEIDFVLIKKEDRRFIKKNSLYCYVLRREVGHVLKSVFAFSFESQMKKWRP